jgi:hypothetical protein
MLAFQNAGQLLGCVDFSLPPIYNSSTLLRGAAPLHVYFEIVHTIAVRYSSSSTRA